MANDQNDCFIRFPMLSVKPNYSTIYYTTESLSGFNYAASNYIQPEHNQHHGVLSDKAKGRIRTAVNWLVAIAKNKKIYDKKLKRFVRFRISFITLTLPAKQSHSDIELKNQALNQFLVEMRKKYSKPAIIDGVEKRVFNYLWKAEKQKNGNIHFHITTDQYIPLGNLRKTWNRILDKLGYIDQYRNNMKSFHCNGFRVRKDLLKRYDRKLGKTIDYWTFEQQKQAYEYGLKTNWSNPNTTDVHSVRNIKKLPAYIAEYFTKNELDEKDLIEYLPLQEEYLALKIKAKELQKNISEDEFLLPEEQIQKIEEKLKQVTKQCQDVYAEIRKKFGDKIVEGRIWGLSQSLSNIKLNIQLEGYFETVGREVLELVEALKDRVIESDFFTVIPATIREIRDFGCTYIMQAYFNLVYTLRGEPLRFQFHTINNPPT